MIDGLNGLSYERFLLHYTFPPYSVGDVGRFGAPGRREVGHGKLAWRALHPVLPTIEEFPYTIRVLSDIPERSAEHPPELQSLIPTPYAVLGMKTKKSHTTNILIRSQ